MMQGMRAAIALAEPTDPVQCLGTLGQERLTEARYADRNL